MNRQNVLVCALLVLIAALSVPAAAIEKLESFDVEIEVLTDGRLEVVERISARAEGNRIKRGIYRDLKLTFTDLDGTGHSAAYEILEVTRDGQPEHWFTNRLEDSLRVYIGQKSVLLKPGVYDYLIRYVTDYQLGFSDSHDSLYWNVTGNDWEFSIGGASATITLPGNDPDIDFRAYTGASGSKSENARVARRGRVLTAHTNSGLNYQEGLTVFVRWPAGSVIRPEGVARFRKLPGIMGALNHISGWIHNGIATLVAIALTLCGMGWLWGRAPGVDRRSGVRSTPPRKLGPAATRWVSEGSYDAGTLKAALVSLASKGRLRIREEETDGFFGTSSSLSVEKLDVTTGPAMTAGEAAVMNTLFSASQSVVPISTSRRLLWQRVSDSLKHRMDTDYAAEFFEKDTDLKFKAGMVVAVLFGGWLLLGTPSRSWVPIVIGAVIMFLLFCALISSRTASGAQVNHEIKRFRKYLAGDYPNAPPVDAQEWETLLPYAVALDVTEEWTERAGSGSTQPVWYSGSRFATLGITEALSSLTDDLGVGVARSSSEQGSSSHDSGGGGGGGGGSSGGGGGGGGGGGW